MIGNDKILALGFGNDILSDDGIGVKIIEKLNRENYFKNLVYNTAPPGGFEFVNLFQGYKYAIIVNGIKTNRGLPGRVYHFQPNEFQRVLQISNNYDISFLTAIKFGKKLGLYIPQNIHIIAVEIFEDRIFSKEFSPTIKKQFKSIYREIKTIVSEIIHKYTEFKPQTHKNIIPIS